MSNTREEPERTEKNERKERTEKDLKDKKDRRQSRSVRLRKYALVYQECLENAKRVTPSSDQKEEKSKKKKHTLNDYQKFVQEESRKEKYKLIPGSQRLTAIAHA